MNVRAHALRVEQDQQFDRALFDTAIARWWNPQAHDAVLHAEQRDRDRLNRL